MNFNNWIYEEADGLGLLKINRPKAMNALNKETLDELGQFLESATSSNTLKALIVTGEGKAFIAGADIKEFENFGEKEAVELAERGQSIFRKLETLPVPTIAAINGFALGGGFELALSCDIILASSKAKMGLPEVSLGVIPGYGGTQRLARTAGKGVAKTVALTGDIFSAAQMNDWGVAQMVCEPEELMDKAQEMAKTLCSRGPVAMSLVKQAIDEGFDLEIDKGFAHEASLFGLSFATRDKDEGVKAFIEKRPPVFQGK